MTYQEYFKKIRTEFQSASQKYLEAENELFNNGFQNINLLQKYAKAKVEFENAANLYNTYIDFVSRYNINPSEEMIKLE
jgi:hypothetical protein